MVNLGNEWDALLSDEFKKPYYLKLREFLKSEYNSRRIFPPMDCIFNALKYASYNDIKVVILGQDPYHGYGQAHGLCFSVQEGTKPPPSLVNIFKEINAELGISFDFNYGQLSGWAKQGILLLNTVLTVREGQANSHRGKGWETFTDSVISLLNKREKPVIFLLWGGNAKSKMPIITNPNHKILTSVHPSPLSAFNGFFGCNHFIKTNELLQSWGETTIDWSVSPEGSKI